jgi:transferase CAF17, mitochondrial
MYAAFLSSQGRILYDVFIHPDSLIKRGNIGESFLIEVGSSKAEALAKHIKRYKLRSKFDVRLLPPDEATVWQAWDTTTWNMAENSLSQTVIPDAASAIQTYLPTSNQPALILKDPRVPDFGYRMITLGDVAPALDLNQSTEEAYRIRRYMYGIAEGQEELVQDHSLPLDSNMDIMNGIDFRKGCYVGQELTIRTKHRGVVRKRILPCIIYGAEKAPPAQLRYSASNHPEEGPEAVTTDMIPHGASIGRHGKNGRSAGKWLAGTGNIGLALCRLEVMTDITLPGETASAYNPADEFTVEARNVDEGGTSDLVKIKAFVPQWLRRGLDQPGH